MTDTERLLTAETERIELGTTIEKGIRRCRNGDWETGLGLLRKAARKEEREVSFSSLYYSYLGYGAARFDGERKDGLALCKHAVQMDRDEPENYLNLARVYLLAGDRKRAVAAVQQGLKANAHFVPLLALRAGMGYRQRPVLGFLSRDNWLNRLLGKRRHSRLKTERETV